LLEEKYILANLWKKLEANGARKKTEFNFDFESEKKVTKKFLEKIRKIREPRSREYLHLLLKDGKRHKAVTFSVC
jgi:hypothetical protein